MRDGDTCQSDWAANMAAEARAVADIQKLAKENSAALSLLCRSCNSTKGAKE